MTTQPVDQSATYTMRECIRAGVRPGLQNHCHHGEWSVEQIGENAVFLVRRVICGPCWEREVKANLTCGWGPDVAQSVAQPADGAVALWCFLMGGLSGACMAILFGWLL